MDVTLQIWILVISALSPIVTAIALLIGRLYVNAHVDDVNIKIEKTQATAEKVQKVTEAIKEVMDGRLTPMLEMIRDSAVADAKRTGSAKDLGKLAVAESNLKIHVDELAQAKDRAEQADKDAKKL